MAREWEKWDTGDVAELIETYWRDSLFETVHRDTLIDLVSRYLTDPGMTVLEVGCGTGLIYQRLVPRCVPNDRYVGLDVSTKMLNIARRNFPAGQFLRGDGFQLAFADRAFDLVVCFEVLGHIPHNERFVSELLRVARRACIFTVWPTADDDVVDSGERLDGQQFLHRRYSDAYVQRLVRSAHPAAVEQIRVAILSSANWAYVVPLTAATEAPGAPKMFPFGDGVERIARLVDQHTTAAANAVRLAERVKLARLRPVAAMWAAKRERSPRRRLARWYRRVVPAPDWNGDPTAPGGQQIDEMRRDSSKWLPTGRRFRLGPSRNLQDVAFICYPFQPGRANLCGVWIAPIFDLPAPDGMLGVEVVSPTNEIVAHSAVDLEDVTDGAPILIRFPPIAASDRGAYGLRVFVREARLPVRIAEWRRYRLRGFGRLETRPFCGLIFADDDRHTVPA